MQTTDLFEWYYDEPQELIDLVNQMERTEQERGLEYDDCMYFLRRANKMGYTFDYGLDATPINLRKLNDEPAKAMRTKWTWNVLMLIYWCIL